MKQPFKVGERVRVFTWDINEPESDGTFDGEVRRIAPSGMLEVSHPEFSDCWVHPRQCRRLIKKDRKRFHGKWKRVQNPDGAWSIAFVPQGPYDTFDRLIGFEMQLIEARKNP